MLHMSAIKTIRERLKLTQAAFAEGIGCTQGNVVHYERGQTVPPAAARRVIDFCAQRGLTITFDHIYGAAEIEGDAAQAGSDPTQAPAPSSDAAAT